MKRLTASLLLALAVFAGVNAQNEPTVTTNARHARGATMAFGRATFKSNGGNNITERGYCWSTENREPTLNDSSSKETLSNNGLIFWMKGLEPATLYYARPYAKSANGSVGYGQTIKIVTLPKGNITWGYDNGADDAANARINTAVAECVDYWNNLTSIPDLYLNVHYGSQTPTADCSYGGWMRVGPNSSYQKTGTIMHEALHAIGVGQHDMWYGSNSPLRAGSGTGQWLGDRANELLHFWDNDASSVLKGDGTHLWPYGINGAHEDNGTKALYVICSLIAQAVGEDGLPCTGSRGYASPCYSFDQENDVKYYIRNESDDYGLKTSFLVETSDHKLAWKEMKAEEAAKNDAAAWYVTFTPSNQYYQFRNAATGYYITYNGSGANGICTVERSAIASKDNFHLMRSRCDVKTTTGSLVTSERGYWIIHPESKLNPACMMATTNGAVTTGSLDLADASARQRWLILTAQQAADMENYGLIVSREEYAQVKQLAQNVLSVDAIEVTEGARQAFGEKIESLNTKVNTTSSVAEVSSAKDQLIAAIKNYLGNICTSDITQPLDVTFLLKNPDFATDKSGWTGLIASGGTWNNQLVEFYESQASAVQTLTDMPKGTYQLKAQAFQRPGGYSSVYASYTQGNSQIKGKLYLNSASTGYVYLKNIMDDRSSTRLHSDDKEMTDHTFIPNTMASVGAYFDKGLYDNVTQYYLGTPGSLKLGLVATDNNNSSYWTIFSNFRLYYYGPKSIAEIEEIIATGIHQVEEESASSTITYNLSGQRVNQPSRGLYIVNNKKIMIK